MLCLNHVLFRSWNSQFCYINESVFIEDVKAGDSEEDAEARSLLNKFLGAQVMLQGMEPLVKASQSQSAALVSQVERQRVLASQKVGPNLISVTHPLHHRGI